MYQLYSTRKGYFTVLPAAGFRNYSDGSYGGLSTSGHYWSSPLTRTGKSFRLRFASNLASTDEDGLAYGYSVRCVQVFTVTLLLHYLLKLSCISIITFLSSPSLNLTSTYTCS